MRKNRVLAFVLALVLLVSMVPAQVIAATISYKPGNANNTTVTISDANGTRITGAALTVTYGANTFQVSELGNGQYAFTRNTAYKYAVFYITVEKTGFETQTVTMAGNISNVSITMNGTVEVVPDDVYEDFNLYYIASGIIPTSYEGAGDAVNYGPSANNTPLCTLRVNITKLMTYTDDVLYEVNNGNQWHFVPKDESTGLVNAHVIAFWEAVKECSTEETLEALYETGLGNQFYGYCLKKQNDSSQHLDGVLNVQPPVYVVELYQNDVFFGGGVTDSAENSKFLTAYDILDQYEAHLKQVITWVENDEGRPLLVNDSYYLGTYVDNDTNKIHNIKVFQTNTQGAAPVEGSEIPYTKQSDSYYLAQYNMDVDAGTLIQYLVTYTDGVDNEVIFNDHEYAATRNQIVPAYTGVTIRDEYAFLGWYLEGSTNTSKIYTDAEIATMKVTKNMTFHAVWQSLPKYYGTIILVLDGTYDAATEQLLSGTFVDPADIGAPENVTLMVSANGKKFYTLDRQSKGVYTSQLIDGTYQIYYSVNGSEPTIASDRVLIIENHDRTRHIFYNSLTYNPNGGTLDGAEANRVEYYASGTQADVYATAPQREGYIFLGWEEQADPGSLYQPGQLLHSGIDHGCTLVAQWKKDIRANVNLTIYVDHSTAGGVDPDPTNGSLTVELVYRANENEPYVEIVGDDYTHTHDHWAEDGVTTGNTTVITHAPFYTDLDIAYQYSVNAILPDYFLYDRHVTATTDAEGNITYDVVLKLRYEPKLFQVEYQIVVDESVSDEKIPQAVDVKLYSWNARVPNAWAPITRHVDYSVDVELAGRNGYGSYPAPVYKDTGIPYYYFAAAVGFTLADGTELTATPNADFTVWYSDAAPGYPAGAFWATLEVTGATIAGSSIPGVYGEQVGDAYVQAGSILITVYTKNYNVTFDPNGGSLNGSENPTVLTEQYVAPSTDAYVPTREGGYVFDGWYLADGSTMAPGEALTEDITYIAKWRDPISVSGIVSVAGGYEAEEKDGTITYHYMADVDRVKYVTAVLQRLNPSGYYETIARIRLDLDYAQTEYYFQKTPDVLMPIGVAFYEFDELPNDGSQYRIQILASNYHTFYQNEPEAADAVAKLQYNTYTDEDYIALLGEVEPNVASVNAHLHFDPETFDLHYQVDSSAIGTGYRPTDAEILVTTDTNYAVTNPSSWPVIYEMTVANGYEGDLVAMGAEGFGSSSFPVWISWPGGAALYDYAIRLYATVTDGEKTLYSEENPYFSVSYQAPAYYVKGENGFQQNQMLIAYLNPKSYTVTFEANGGILNGSATYAHTWSYATQLPQLEPTRAGYKFLGWYADAQLTQKVTPDVISADVAENITYYAKWEQVMDNVHLEVVIDHTTANSGLAGNYEKLLNVILTRREEGTEQDFLPVDGTQLTFGNEYWHTRGDGMNEDAFFVPDIYTGLSGLYDYNVSVTLDGYFRQAEVEAEFTTKTVHEDGSATHYVYVYLKFSPDLLDLNFSVEMADGVDEVLYPVAADVKISCWYNHPGVADLGWHVITQHEHSVVQVKLDENGNGSGSGSYPVWQWLNQEYAVPYYYRMEVVALQLSDGSTVLLEEQEAEALYVGGGYSATVYAEDGCEVPNDVTDDGIITPADTDLEGAYGVPVNLEAAEDGSHYYSQRGTLKAVIDVGKVVFHANNPDAEEDTFRTYYPTVAPLPEGDYYNLNADGTIDPFYAIPEFDYHTHNNYIFKGWYMDADSDAEPMNWNTVWEGSADVYAHWIYVGSVAQEEDGKKLPEGYSYKEFDLVGAQIRVEKFENDDHYGQVAPGLRFVASLSTRVWSQLQALDANAQYGFLLANADTARYFAQQSGKEDYEILYKGANVNGVDTRADYTYVKNLLCSGVPDHYAGENYRLYTGVVTYNGLEGEALESAQATDLLARAYLSYTDANGLARIHHHNYAGTETYNGLAVSYATMETLIEGGN